MSNSPKDLYKKLLGRSGERTAEEFLKKSGYTILEKNFKTKVGEIDIIAMEKGVIVFTEVKTRTDNSYGAPSEAVDKNKQRKYYKVAEEYLLKNKKTDFPCRFDVIEIENGSINHIKDAFSM